MNTNKQMFFTVIIVCCFLNNACTLNANISDMNAKGILDSTNPSSPELPSTPTVPTSPSLPKPISLTVDGPVMFDDSATPVLNWTPPAGAASNFSYQIAIGSNEGGTDVLGWMNVGNTLTAALNSLSLIGAKKYFASIRTVNPSGAFSEPTTGASWYNLTQTKLAIEHTAPYPRAVSQSARFGNAVAISEDRSTLVVGAYYDKLDTQGLNYLNSAGAVFVYVKSGGVWTLQQKLVAPDRQDSDLFGSSIDISADTIVIGSPGHAYDANNSNKVVGAGAAYVFTRSSGTWTLQQKLIPTGTNARVSNDAFGTAVSISTDTIAVGATGQDTDASGSTSLTDAGAIFVFTRSSSAWTQQQKIVPTGTNARIAGNSFGRVISLDADTLGVGVETHIWDATGSTSLSGAGAAFIFFRTGTTWNQQQKIIGSGSGGRASNDRFGNTISVNGNTVAIGSYGNDTNAAGGASAADAGAVFVYTRSGSTWSLEQKLVPTTGTNARVAADNFGRYVSLDGNTLAITADRNDYDENGSNYIDGSGVAFIFKRSGTTWTQYQRIAPSGVNARSSNQNWFGNSIAVSGDTVIVGNANSSYDDAGGNLISSAGAAYIYKETTGVWAQEKRLVDTLTPASRIDLAVQKFGSTIAISNDGSTLAVANISNRWDETDTTISATAIPSIYIYTKTNDVWTLQQRIFGPTTNTKPYLGQGNIVIDGDTMVIGSPTDRYDENDSNSLTFAGSVMVYYRSGGVWTLQQKIVPTGTNARNSWDTFGSSVSLSGDTLAVGCPNHSYDASGGNLSTNAGAVFVYTRNGASWSPQQKIVATGPNARIDYDYFGTNVSLDGDVLAISSNNPNDSTGSNPVLNSGSVFIYKRTSNSWSLQQRLTAVGADREVGAKFGSAMSMSGTTLAVSLPYNSTDENGVTTNTAAGAVSIFTSNGTTWTQQKKIVPKPSMVRSAGNFGKTLTLNGNFLAVGYPNYNLDSKGANSISNAGIGILYERKSNVWSEKLLFSPKGTNARTANDIFGGYPLSMGVDNSNRFFIGVSAPDHGYDTSGNNPALNAGAVFIFH